MGKILIFNWKMAPDSLKEAISLFKRTRTCADKRRTKAEIIIAPPFIYLSDLSLVIGRESSIKLASQDVFYEKSLVGNEAYTGEISANMLKNIKVNYSLIGHSERRKRLCETDEIVNKKILTALKTGLRVILCVGEDLSVRKLGKEAIEKFIKNQLEKDLRGIFKSSTIGRQLLIAYEPIWSIGTGHCDTPEDAAEMIRFIKKVLNFKFRILNSPVLYGGSVDSKNISGFLEYSEIDGFLIGHASLKIKEVERIISKI